jgi:hypothetical protein
MRKILNWGWAITLVMALIGLLFFHWQPTRLTLVAVFVYLLILSIYDIKEAV